MYVGSCETKATTTSGMTEASVTSNTGNRMCRTKLNCTSTFDYFYDNRNDKNIIKDFEDLLRRSEHLTNKEVGCCLLVIERVQQLAPRDGARLKKTLDSKTDSQSRKLE